MDVCKIFSAVAKFIIYLIDEIVHYATSVINLLIPLVSVLATIRPKIGYFTTPLFRLRKKYHNKSS